MWSLLVAWSAGPSAWRSRAIYQVVTDRFAVDGSPTCGDGGCQWGNYCGGSFKALEGKLDYIRGMGFDAIWISPVVDNFECGYHGYWARDFTAVNSHFGQSGDLKALVAAAHAKGMFVMVDIVANHVGAGDRSQVVPFSSDAFYHSPCGIDYDDQSSIEQCWLAGLPDLKQEDGQVQDLLLEWAADLVTTYDLDGLRIDTVPYVPKDFWAALQEKVGVYTVGEVLIGTKPTSYVADYQSRPGSPGLDAVLNYPLKFALSNVFVSKQSMWNLHNALKEQAAFEDTTVLGTFLDNHDQPRFLYQQPDQALLRNGLAFLLGWRGVPIVYYGTEQLVSCGGSDDANRCPLWEHGYSTDSAMYQWLATAVQGRGAGDVQERWVDDNLFAFSRGDALYVTFNCGSGCQHADTITNMRLWPSGTTVCDDFSRLCQPAGGDFHVQTSNGEPQVWRPKSAAVVV